ncbi:NAD(P)H-dependent oxidoreductase [Aeromonas salmonicida]|uniref:NAD(P)H-dependent oxidoreductase n=1 Tax=Aeromonas salmonicida TaxID=645 RepID=UPI002796709F|nr:NAD(P)H-dependent oxidoreductase [Aeromonas salmonicida]MDQ1883856.1 NAD(P)H-dependent oxidoreductase [Aeromonas salmonicida]
MPPRLLVINGNPKPDSFCHALAREYARSAEEAGAEVTLLHVGELAFEPDLRHGYDLMPPLEPDLLALQQSLSAAHHLVIVSPLWWGNMPARLKGLLDRTLLSGFAFQYVKGKALPLRLLAGKTARLLLTMDSPVWYYRWWLGDPASRILDKQVLGLCGIRLTHRQYLGPMHTASDQDRARWLTETCAAARADVRRLSRRT